MDQEFDHLAPEYEELLNDSVREYFAPGSEFFLTRKIDVLLEFAAREGLDTRQATWLDVGCGKGELLRAARPHFARALGCDVSVGMIAECGDLEVVHQSDPLRLPFPDGSVDWVTAVCIFHHINPEERAPLIADIYRVLRPGGIFANIEHNPFNPAVQLIIRRTPVDKNAKLLTARTARRLMHAASMQTVASRYFLYAPQRVYGWAAPVERALGRTPLGGQYVVFGRKPKEPDAPWPKPRVRELLRGERNFHDRWAESIDVDGIRVSDYFEACTAPENRFILEHLGDVSGKTLLDLGCGAGENSVYFSLKGAHCTATDYSSGMVEKALKLAAANGVQIEARTMNVMEIEFPDNTFDIVYAANLLHHLPDPVAALREMHRVLKPGGKACFWDPLRHNPVINVYRRMAMDVRTKDERPLDIGIIKCVKSLFSETVYDSFWLATLWIFLRFYLIERVDPNKERYWKKIIAETSRLQPTYHRLEWLDRLIKQAPFMKRFAWNIAVVATK